VPSVPHILAAVTQLLNTKINNYDGITNVIDELSGRRKKSGKDWKVPPAPLLGGRTIDKMSEISLSL
jgi:hypothetical protein